MTKYKLSAFSYFSIEGNSVKLVVGPSYFELFIMGTISISLISIFFAGFNLINSGVFFLLFCSFCMFLKLELSYIHISNNMIIRKKQLLGLTFKTTTYNWEKSSYFSHKFEYDTYGRFSSIKVLVKSIDNKDCKTLCEFKSEKDFNSFKEVFNQKFPSKAIKEWHE